MVEEREPKSSDGSWVAQVACVWWWRKGDAGKWESKEMMMLAKEGWALCCIDVQCMYGLAASPRRAKAGGSQWWLLKCKISLLLKIKYYFSLCLTLPSTKINARVPNFPCTFGHNYLLFMCVIIEKENLIVLLF